MIKMAWTLNRIPAKIQHPISKIALRWIPANLQDRYHPQNIPAMEAWHWGQ